MLKPLADRVIVKMSQEDEITKSGIILSSGAKEKSQVAEVLAVGPGGMIEGNNVEMYVAKGQRVVINKYAGTEVKYNGEELTIVRQSDILAIIE